MKKIIITICTALMLLTFTSTITADNVEDSKDPFIELNSASADTASASCSVFCDTSKVVAIVIQVLDDDNNVLAMEALEANSGTSNYRINVPLTVGETYTVRVANYDKEPYGTDGAPWHILEVVAKKTGGGGSESDGYSFPVTGVN